MLSGGLDSAVALALATAQGYKLHGIYFDYGQLAANREKYLPIWCRLATVRKHFTV